VTKADIDWAVHFNAVLACFAVPIQDSVKQYAIQKAIPIKSQDIIYKLMDDIKGMLSEKLGTAMQHVPLGYGKIREVFPGSGKKKTKEFIAGIVVDSGSITNQGYYQVVRNGEVIWTGELESIRHFKDTVSVMEQGKECGVKLKDFNDYKVGDVIKNLKEEAQQRQFDDSSARTLDPELQEETKSKSCPIRQSLAFRTTQPEPVSAINPFKKLLKMGKEIICDERIKRVSVKISKEEFLLNKEKKGQKEQDFTSKITKNNGWQTSIIKDNEGTENMEETAKDAIQTRDTIPENQTMATPIRIHFPTVVSPKKKISAME